MFIKGIKGPPIRLTPSRASILLDMADYLLESFPQLIDAESEQYKYDLHAEDYQAAVSWIKQQVYKRYSPRDLNPILNPKWK